MQELPAARLKRDKAEDGTHNRAEDAVQADLFGFIIGRLDTQYRCDHRVKARLASA